MFYFYIYRNKLNMKKLDNFKSAAIYVNGYQEKQIIRENLPAPLFTPPPCMLCGEWRGGGGGEVLFLIKWPRGGGHLCDRGGRERPFKGLCLPHPPPPSSFILIFSPALPYHNLDYENNPCLKGKGDSEKTCLF
nr:hypothetical protein [Morchella crassipes]